MTVEKKDISGDLEERLSRFLKKKASCECKTLESHKAVLEERTPKRSDLEQTVHLFKAIADTTRLQILFILADGVARCLCELESVLDVTQPTITHHVKRLQAVGLLKAKRDQKWLLCSIKDKKVMETISGLREHLEKKI